MTELPRLKAKRRSGDERLTDGQEQLPFTLRDFWCWSTSDLLNNTTRGVLAEFLVASALEIPTSGVRDPWAAYDLVTADGLKIEVKSAAYLQSWAQKGASNIIFNVPKTRAWNPDTNGLAKQSTRQADVYVFALLAHQDKTTVNPLDVSQWHFYVLSSNLLNERTRSQDSITLNSIQALSGGSVTYQELAAKVRSSVQRAQEAG
jgi:hypothetical protein